MIPIIIGLVLAATGWLPPSWGVPSFVGDRVGWVGVLLLAFTAGLETRQSRQHDATGDALPASRTSSLRFMASAGIALLLPFGVGALLAYAYFTGLPNWAAPNGDKLLGAIAIGLCIAVSALPVLIGIVRELGPLHRPLTRVAVSIAVFDDAVPWIGLAVLLIRSGANGRMRYARLALVESRITVAIAQVTCPDSTGMQTADRACAGRMKSGPASTSWRWRFLARRPNTCSSCGNAMYWLP